MGALDDCYCEYPLPDPDLPLAGWQTKDFGRDGRTIVIKPDGTIWRATNHVIPNPDWTPEVRIKAGLRGPWIKRTADEIEVWDWRLRRVMPTGASLRICGAILDRFVEYYLAVDVAGGRVTGVISGGVTMLFRSTFWGK